MRVLFYTSGEIGGGHLAKALAIQRGLERGGVSVDFRVLYSRLPLRPPPGLDVVPVSAAPEELADPARARDSALARAIHDAAPDLLLVDLAWRDLRHLLPLPGVEAWLLLRWCPPQFLKGPFNTAFRQDWFRRVIGIEPIVPVEVTDSIAPLVVCNPDECHGRGDLRRRLGIQDERPVTLVVQAGLPGERDELLRYERERDPERESHIIGLSLHDEDPLVPVAPWLPGADRIVGGAGYNLFWETEWLGLRPRTELHVFRRNIDDQTPRMRLTRDYVMRENGADVLARWIAGRA
ncbi:MAG: hypothetical protein FJ104_04680 [Deltaproteobacteria bacterium]|nr:hypothetical protein [Deltaproteobacteria bacterium]